MSASSDFDRAILEFFNDDPLTATYLKFTVGVYDPSTGEASVTNVEIPVKCILLDMTRTNNGLSSKFGTLVSEGDKECYILPVEKADPLAIPLVIDTTSDRLKIGSITYNVAAMKEANPTGSAPLLYNLMLKR